MYNCSDLQTYEYKTAQEICREDGGEITNTCSNGKTYTLKTADKQCEEAGGEVIGQNCDNGHLNTLKLLP